MQIVCPKCKKIFIVSDSLIPKDGRSVQCGSCNHKWHYKQIIENNQVESNLPTEVENIIKEAEYNNNFEIDEKIEIKKENSIKKEVIDNNNLHKQINIFKFLLVFILSVIAILILIDTFKYQISIFYPSIITIMDSLYETIKDLYLFILDLVK